MDDQPASNSTVSQAPTWRERVTSSLGLPASKSGRTRNRFSTPDCREKSPPIVKATKQRTAFNEPATGNLLSPDSDTAVPETDTKDNNAVENGTSNKNYIQSADEEDRHLVSCNVQVDKLERNCVIAETSYDCDGFQMSGNRLSWLSNM